MKYGILGDIHSNQLALEAVLRGLEGHGVEQVISVGDVVGYGAAPSNCIRLLQEAGAIVVRGNHDAAVAGILDASSFNPHARAAVAWTAKHLGEEAIAWLRALPLTATTADCQVAHGTVAEPERFHYLFGPADAVESLDTLERPVGFVGHSHVPVAVLRLADMPDRLAYTYDPLVELGDVHRAILNVGSVGQPRDQDPRAAYFIYDSAERRGELHRVEYDVEFEARRILDAGLPAILAERLAMGV